MTIPAQELADMLGLHVQSVYAGARAGEIPCRRIGRRYVFVRAAIEAWLGETSHNGGAGRPARAGA